MSIILHKEVGETPLECLERGRRSHGIDHNIPMTYAGRLDPMAEGLLLVLVGEECKEKDKFLGFNKEYEVEVLFGISTDSQDPLGLITEVNVDIKISKEFIRSIPERYTGAFSQKYPVYSSKTIEGKALHTHARENTLPKEDRDMPTRDIKIFSIEIFGQLELSGREIAEESIKKIKKVKGDFRQTEIVKGWHVFAEKYGQANFSILKIKVNCSTGTYMRILAENIGAGSGSGALAYSINRTKVGKLSI